MNGRMSCVSECVIYSIRPNLSWTHENGLSRVVGTPHSGLRVGTHSQIQLLLSATEQHPMSGWPPDHTLVQCWWYPDRIRDRVTRSWLVITDTQPQVCEYEYLLEN